MHFKSFRPLSMYFYLSLTLYLSSSLTHTADDLTTAGTGKSLEGPTCKCNFSKQGAEGSTSNVRSEKKREPTSEYSHPIYTT